MCETCDEDMGRKSSLCTRNKHKKQNEKNQLLEISIPIYTRSEVQGTKRLCHKTDLHVVFIRMQKVQRSIIFLTKKKVNFKIGNNTLCTSLSASYFT